MRLNILPLIAALMVLACTPETRADCASPAGPEAKLLYNKDYHVLQYCDGTNWVAMGAAGTGIANGLVGWWKLDDGSGTSAADSSGNGNTGTLTNGPTWTTGQLGGALSFDGVNDYVDIGTTFDVSSVPFSVSAWVKPSNYNDYGTIFAKRDYFDPARERFNLTIDRDDGVLLLQEGSGGTNFTFSYAPPVNQWTHLVVVAGTSGTNLYVNGSLQETIDAFSLGTDSTASTRIGNTGEGPDQFAGLIDDVRIYNRALSAAEIYGLYSCKEGTLRYNADYRTLEYCNSAAWQGVARVYTAWGVSFDGTNDYLTRGADLTGGADSTKATGSFWFRRNGGNGTQQVLWCTLDTAGSCRFQIDLSTGNNLHLLGTRTNGAATLDATGGTAITDTNWHHALFSVDLADSAKRYIYLDGAAETPTWTTYANNVIDFTRTEHSVGAFTNGASKFNGDLADFYLDMGTWTDFSVAVKREMFRDANGKPVDPGSGGSIPTGSAPEVFLSGATLSTWPTNKGSGGGFTVTGALTAATGTDGAGGIRRGLVGYWKLDDGGSGSADIGQTGLLSTPDNGNGNLLVAQLATLAATGTIQSMSFYVTAASGNLRLGIYDATGPSGGPGAKKAETAEITPVAGWNTANVTTPVALPAGTYWLAYLPSDNNLAFVKDYLGGGSRYYSYTYGAMPATFSTSPSSDGAQWSLYASLNGVTSVTAADSSGNGNTGTLTNGPTWTTGQLGGALSFDGADDYVDVAGTTAYATQNAPFSFSAWVNLTDFSNFVPDIMQIRSDTASPWHVLLSNNASYLGISLGSNSTWVTIKTDNVPSLGAWHHIAVTYNGNGAGTIGNFQIYLDTVPQTLAGAAGYGNQSQQSRIGGAESAANLWHGLIDDVRIYNRALSAADVAALYANSAVCSGPSTISRQEGTILYNADYHVLQYCDGLTWRGIGK